MSANSRIIPTMKYKNAAAAVDWLSLAFGFNKKAVFPDGNGGIAHAQLTYGSGMIMISSESDTPYGRLMAVPKDLDNMNTQSANIILDDSLMKSHYENAIRAGAKVALPLEAQSYGGHAYSVFDPEGHLWNFGSYDPWAEDV